MMREKDAKVIDETPEERTISEPTTFPKGASLKEKMLKRKQRAADEKSRKLIGKVWGPVARDIRQTLGKNVSPLFACLLTKMLVEQRRLGRGLTEREAANTCNLPPDGLRALRDQRVLSQSRVYATYANEDPGRPGCIGEDSIATLPELIPAYSVSDEWALFLAPTVQSLLEVQRIQVKAKQFLSSGPAKSASAIPSRPEEDYSQ